MMNMQKLPLIALDLESVLFPEIWQAVSEDTGIADLAVTTRDVADYGALMEMRIHCLRENNIKLDDILTTIRAMQSLPGAIDFFRWLRGHAPVMILSDTFYEFAGPLMSKIGAPTLICNSLVVDAQNYISGYKLRHPNGKQNAVETLQNMGFWIFAVGDSYNDLAMLQTANLAAWFRPPVEVMAEYPQFPVFFEYSELREWLIRSLTDQRFGDDMQARIA